VTQLTGDADVQNIWTVSQLNALVKDILDADRRTANVRINGMDVILHAFLGWDTYGPEWFTGGKFTPEELETILDTQIKTVMDQYHPDIWAVHPVNEVFQANGSWRAATNDQWITWVS